MGIMRDGSKAVETREGTAHALQRWSASHSGAGRRAYLCHRARLRAPREQLLCERKKGKLRMYVTKVLPRPNVDHMKRGAAQRPESR